MKTYKVVPYVANITTKETTTTVAQKLEVLINDFACKAGYLNPLRSLKRLLTIQVVLVLTQKPAGTFFN